eukprot:scaffold1978_cov381-Prasinococcus_capsulatus_cf.AAC.3
MYVNFRKLLVFGCGHLQVGALTTSLCLADPDMMPRLQVDSGAIRFVLSGANIMCPGLTSSGAHMEDDIEEDTAVAIYAEGKQHALALGLTKMSTKDMKAINKGIGVDNMHHLNDGLWKVSSSLSST